MTSLKVSRPRPGTAAAALKNKGIAAAPKEGVLIRYDLDYIFLTHKPHLTLAWEHVIRLEPHYSRLGNESLGTRVN